MQVKRQNQNKTAEIKSNKRNPDEPRANGQTFGLKDFITFNNCTDDERNQRERDILYMVGGLWGLERESVEPRLRPPLSGPHFHLLVLSLASARNLVKMQNKLGPQKPETGSGVK